MVPEVAGVEGGVHGDDIADGAVVDFLDGGLGGEGVSAIETGDEGEFFFFGNCGAFGDGADAGGVGGHGFFGEDVFAGLNGVFDVGRAEAGRGGEQHDIDAGVDELLVGIKADETAVGRDVDLIWRGSGFLDTGEAALEAVWERVGHGDEDGALVGGECLGGGAGSAAAAADEANFETVTASGVDGGGND